MLRDEKKLSSISVIRVARLLGCAASCFSVVSLSEVSPPTADKRSRRTPIPATHIRDPRTLHSIGVYNRHAMKKRDRAFLSSSGHSVSIFLLIAGVFLLCGSSAAQAQPSSTAASTPGLYNPVADTRAVVTAGHARFTVLTPQLIRMEWSADGKFEDHPSLVFLNRHCRCRSSPRRTMRLR